MTPASKEEIYLAKLCGEEWNLPYPTSRLEYYYAKLCGMDVPLPTNPLSRPEFYLAHLCGQNVKLPEPVSRKEMYMAKACGLEVEKLPEALSKAEIYWRMLLLQITEYIGELPLTFETNSSYLMDYRIYGNTVSTLHSPSEWSSCGIRSNYEPYRYKIPITIHNGNGQSSLIDIDIGNEPLCKIGKYVDYINFKTQQLIKNVAVVTFTGEEEWRAQGNAYFTYIAHTLSETPPTLCSAFLLSTSGNTAVGEYRLAGIDSWNGNVLFNYDNGADGVVNFKSYLAQQYANGTPVQFLYALPTPVSSSLPLPIIPISSTTSTTFSVDTGTPPSEMYIKYIS